jgi:hypothetical protein
MHYQILHTWASRAPRRATTTRPLYLTVRTASQLHFSYVLPSSLISLSWPKPVELSRLCSVRLPHQQAPVGRLPIFDSGTAALWGRSARGASGLRSFRPGKGAHGAAPASAAASLWGRRSDGSLCIQTSPSGPAPSVVS